MRWLFSIIFTLYLLFAAEPEVGVVEHLGKYVSTDLTFTTDKGEKKSLKEMMENKPVILTFNYYRCAGICTPQLVELAKTIGKVKLKEGEDYKIITIGIAEEGEENVELAANKKRNILKAIGREFDPDGWIFTLTDGNSSKILADEVGFKYKRQVSPAGRVDYLHGASAIALSPSGKITRYLNGVNQLPFDIKMAILEASEGRTGPTIAKVLNYCFSYDPKGRTYVFMWEKVLGVVMTLLLIFFFIYLIRSSKKAQQEINQKKGDNG